MNFDVFFQSILAFSSVIIAGSGLVIAWFQYRLAVESESVDFQFHHAYGIPEPGVWIGITCVSPRAYIHGIDFPDNYAKGTFGAEIEKLRGSNTSGPGPVSQGDVRFARVDEICDDGSFYLSVIASVDKRGRRRTITSDVLTDGLVHPHA